MATEVEHVFDEWEDEEPGGGRSKLEERNGEVHDKHPWRELQAPSKVHGSSDRGGSSTSARDVTEDCESPQTRDIEMLNECQPVHRRRRDDRLVRENLRRLDAHQMEGISAKDIMGWACRLAESHNLS